MHIIIYLFRLVIIIAILFEGSNLLPSVATAPQLLLNYPQVTRNNRYKIELAANSYSEKSVGIISMLNFCEKKTFTVCN